MRFKQMIVLLGLSIALSGCLGLSTTVEEPPNAAPTDAPTRAPEPTEVAIEPTATSEPAATLAPEPTATNEPAATLTPEPTATTPPEPPPAEPADDQYGVTSDGYYVRGPAGAPVVIEDYSDFL